ncbi:MAG: transcriptional regulator, MarR family [Hydrocarboniphaga sp.]|uniref:MarR family winged helix-turn-helix transcriptional regulator n=1 Tax=Hydrocarboniphaga sp. TaxID=2033016 RepID=UPI00260B1EE6|nr:MarR family transcriptional regulator [Hydrocarboniphaga sp.]MDB5968356.1 transcriptional regulator, MarR family [Hydrocarboniphaga sp.]
MNNKLPESLENYTGYLITDIGRLYRTEMDKRMARFELTRSQWWLISFLSHFEGATQQELADVMDVGRAGIAKLIDRLEKKGLVCRAADARDGRSKRVYLSERIKPLAIEVEKEIADTGQSSMRRLGKDDIATLNRLLNTIRATVLEDQQALDAADRPPPDG